jgi:phenylpyruvate tautomerase PptA (4-oxalocrotonate tautomerase family)
MPIIVCENRVGLKAEIKAEIASKVTTAIQEIIRSPLDLISVVFHDLDAQSTYRSGRPSTDTLIFCHLRDGRSDGAILSLIKEVSAIWSACTGDSEDNIEVAAALYPARHVVRAGERLPEAPRV